MAVRSPSPEYTTTCNDGLASFNPVANGMARPCVVWNESSRAYPATRPVQPMPDTTATLSRSALDSSSARVKQLTVVRSEEHTSELQSLRHLVCRLLLEKKKKKKEK